MTFILEASRVSKVIAGRQILKDISLQCTKDTRLLIRGKNGSGKSTLLKILAGITDPSSGEVRGSTCKIGYVPEHFPEELRFKLSEYLLLTSTFQGGSKAIVEHELTKYIQLFGLKPFLHTSLKACSKGTRQKVGIIQALLMEPDLLLLDEPLTGLDAESQQTFIQLLKEKQIPVVFTSHEDELIQSLAKETLQIETGEITSQKAPKVPKKKICVSFQVIDDLSGIATSQIVFNGNVAVLTVDGEESDQVLQHLLQKNCSILEVRELT